MESKKVNPKIEKYFDNRIAEHQKKLDELYNYLKSKLLDEADRVDNHWNSIVESHSNKNSSLKLIIVGEAPQDFEKYFYNKQGTFLNSLKDHWSLDKNHLLPAKMLIKRVLLLDVYKYPLPPEFYKKDKDNVLFDMGYINAKIEKLKQKKLIDDNTHFVFRYKHLFEERKLDTIDAFKDLKFIKDKGQVVSFNADEKPQNLNDIVKDYLERNCS